MNPSRARLLWPFVLGATLLSGCTQLEEIGLYRTAVPEVSPTAIAELPKDIEAAALTIEDGGFAAEDLYLLEDTPTVLHLTNRDEQGYRLLLTDLLAETEIPPATTLAIEFTTPNANVYEARLYPLDGEEAIDTVRVVVRAAGAVEP